MLLALGALSHAGSMGLAVSAVALVVLGAGNLLVVRRSLVVRHGGSRSTGSDGAPLAACWLLVTVLPLHSFVIRPTTVAVTELGIEPLIELAYFLVVGAYAATVIGRHERGAEAARPPILMLVLPGWTMATAAWSPYGPYAFARGLQMLVLGVLAWATIAAARSRPNVLTDVFGSYVRWLVRLAVALVGVGLALGPILVPAGGANLERFTWMGAHPNASGLVLAGAAVACLTAPVTVLRLSPGARAAVLVVLAAALYANHSRMSWLEVVVGALLAFGLAGRLRPLLRWVGTPLVGMAAFAALVFRGEQIGAYLAREGNSESLGSGNGRRQLWSMGADALETSFDWAFGLGYGVTRTMFLDVGPWARNAHSSLLAWLVSGGAVALVLFLAIAGTTATKLARGCVVRARADGLALVGLFVVIVVNGTASDALAEPTFGYGVLCLLAAVGRVLVDQERGPVVAQVPNRTGFL